MLCPYCSYDDSKVIDSRDSSDDVRRRRECSRCGLRYTTYERVQTRSLQVTKRDGRREEFSRDKLWVSVTRACAKRPLPTGSIDKAVQEIEAELAEMGKSEVSSRIVGELVMDKLKGMDRVAYIRFASVYRDFRDIETFKDEIEALLKPKEHNNDFQDNQLSFLDPDERLTPVRRRRGRPRKHVAPKQRGEFPLNEDALSKNIGE